MLTFPTARTVALTVDEITQRKQELQRRLEIFVHNEIANFQEENRVSISGVYLDFVTERKLIEVHPRLVLSAVVVDIKI